MKFDLHTHHYRCGHAEGSIQDYIEAAIEHGLQVIGISDHSPYFADANDHPHPGTTMARSEFPNYIKEVLEHKERYKDRIEVLLGVESDYFPDHAETYRKVYEQYPFDYIIGSIHHVGGISIFNKKRWKDMDEQQKIEVKDAYHDLIEQSAKSGMFDVLGHIDAMKGYYPEFSDIPTHSIERVLKVIGECGVAIEINTSGKTKYCGGWYPSDDILEKALHYGVQVTFGSDAHVAHRVGDEFEQVAAKLKDIGYKEWVYFRQRERQFVKL